MVPQNKCNTQTTRHTTKDGHVYALDPSLSVYTKPAALISCGSCGGSADGCSWSHSWVKAAGAPSSGLYDSLGEQLKDLSGLGMGQATSALSSNLAHTRMPSVSRVIPKPRPNKKKKNTEKLKVVQTDPEIICSYSQAPVVLTT